MQPPMNHTAYKVTTTRNAYGDYIPSGETAYKCHIRHITEQVTSTNDETVQSDLMLWFEPDVPVTKGSVWKVEGEHFRVERIIKARRLRDPSVQFIKTELLKYGQIS